jgi:hypothetical protein
LIFAAVDLNRVVDDPLTTIKEPTPAGPAGSAGMPGDRVGDDRGILPHSEQQRRPARAQEVDAAEE